MAPSCAFAALTAANPEFLKNGCCIAALQLGSIEKIERALALYMIVAWRIARLMRLGRNCPDLDAQLMFEPDEWQGGLHPEPAERTGHTAHAQ